MHTGGVGGQGTEEASTQPHAMRTLCRAGPASQLASEPRSSRARRTTRPLSTSTAAHQSGRRPRGRQCQWRPGQPPAASPLRMGEGRSRGRVASQSPPSGQCQGAAVGRSDAKGGRPGAAQQEEWPCLGQGLPLHIPQGPNRCTNLLSPVERMEVALSARSRRLRPASASSVPSQAPSCSLRSRVCTLPRKLTTCRGEKAVGVCFRHNKFPATNLHVAAEVDHLRKQETGVTSCCSDPGGVALWWFSKSRVPATAAQLDSSHAYLQGGALGQDLGALNSQHLW